MSAARPIPLSSGRWVELREPRLPLVRHYQVLAWPPGQGPANAAEIDEMWRIAHQLARERGRALFGDEQCFTVLYNGARTRRMPWPHFHLIAARTPAEKRWTLLCLMLKRALRPRRWRISVLLLGASEPASR